MRTIKDVYPDFQDDVAFIAVDVDPSESAETIDGYAAQQGYTWDMAIHHADVMSDFGISRQPSKVLIDGNGIITLRGTPGSSSANTWREALEAVTA